jgi:hypothetical protein
MAGLNVSSGKLQMDTLNSCGLDDNETEKYILLSGRQVFNQKERKMSIECQLEENRKNCTCPEKDCSRNGACCQCVTYHRRAGDLPHCLKRNR